ncbi:MAG: sigma-70 family RNA polymerase sigma factor [Sedimentisphaerales bacterium]|nr:sigma-70 family RNA polymerase sigma factor [Sedimentisphaerales bacterium]
MFHSSGKPNKANRIWPRLCDAVLNTLRIGHREERHVNPDALSVSAMANEDAKDDSQRLLADAVGRELRDSVIAAMRRLKPRHRAVLTFRCFRQMEYQDIAHSLQCSEFAAKIQFYRAKMALQKQLSRQGFGRGAFLAGLILFGKITAQSEAAAKSLAISAATTKVGVAAGLAAVATTKTAVLSVAAAGVIAIGTIAGTSKPQHTGQTDPDQSKAISTITDSLAAVGKGVYEYWHYYPHGTRGPVMMRLLKWDARAKQSYCQWLQNETANYFFDRNDNTVYIRNHRVWHEDHSVWRLPTDNAVLRKSLALAEPDALPIEYVNGQGAGLLVIMKQDQQAHRSQITRNLNVLDEPYFLYDWPSRTRLIDARDTMHERGWTYFTISGRIGENDVSGQGRIPFVHATSKWHYPWLKMTIGNKLRLVDTGTEARLYDGANKLIKEYIGGSFFQSLPRPWMGLHAVDTVRRDAARADASFSTEFIRRDNTAKVTVRTDRIEMVYTIDLLKDVVESIAFSRNGVPEGMLEFAYLQDIEEAAKDFVSPRQESPPKWRRDRLGILWLANLMDARW